MIRFALNTIQKIDQFKVILCLLLMYILIKKLIILFMIMYYYFNYTVIAFICRRSLHYIHNENQYVCDSVISLYFIKQYILTIYTYIAFIFEYTEF